MDDVRAGSRPELTSSTGVGAADEDVNETKETCGHARASGQAGRLREEEGQEARGDYPKILFAGTREGIDGRGGGGDAPAGVTYTGGGGEGEKGAKA